jgi:hypothetical protein
MFSEWIRQGLNCWSKIPSRLPTISEKNVNCHKDFVASMHSGFFLELMDIRCLWSDCKWHDFDNNSSLTTVFLPTGFTGCSTYYPDENKTVAFFSPFKVQLEKLVSMP